MDEVVRKVLLEIIELEYSQHASPLCGFHWCDGVLGRQRPVPCEHLEVCRRNREIGERLLELKADVLGA